MMHLDNNCLAALLSSPDGECRVRFIASNLRRGAAVEFAQEHAHDYGTILLVGSAENHTVDVVFPNPDRVQPDHLNAVAIIRSWIGWLRATSVIRFGDLSVDNPEQCIPPEYFADPDIRRVLGIVLVPQSVLIGWPHAANRSTIRDWIEAAPPKSIAGLLRGARIAECFLEWLEAAPLAMRSKLLIPLYATTALECAQSAGLLFGLAWWNCDGRNAGLICGRLLRLTIDGNGLVACQYFPADRFGIGWSPPDYAIATRPPDAVYRGPFNLDLSRLLAEIPDLVRSVLTGIAQARVMNLKTMNPNSVLDTDENLEKSDCDFQTVANLMADFIESKTHEEIEAIRGSVRANCFPFDGSASTLAMNHFLYANGHPERQLRRRQALKSFPLVATEAAKGCLPCAERAIDRAQPLYPGVCADIGGPLWAIRRARDLSLRSQTIEETGFRNLAALTHMLSLLGTQAPLPDTFALNTLAKFETLVGVGNGSDAQNELARHREILIHSAGRQARIDGWVVTARLLDELIQEPGTQFTVQAYLHVAQDNVVDVLSRQLAREFSTDDSLIQSVLSEWFADTPLSRLMSCITEFQAMCRGGEVRHVIRAMEGLDNPTSEDALFGHCSIVTFQVEAQVLMTADELLAESNAMSHCVHSYAGAVANFDVLIVSLYASSSGKRATVELCVDPEQVWHVRQIKGPGNAVVMSHSRLGRAAADVCELLNQQPSPLCPELLARYRYKERGKQITLANYFDQGSLFIRHLPDLWRARVEALFPGSGLLEGRILHAMRKCEQTHAGRMR